MQQEMQGPLESYDYCAPAFDGFILFDAEVLSLSQSLQPL